MGDVPLTCCLAWQWDITTQCTGRSSYSVPAPSFSLPWNGLRIILAIWVAILGHFPFSDKPLISTILWLNPSFLIVKLIVQTQNSNFWCLNHHVGGNQEIHHFSGEMAQPVVPRWNCNRRKATPPSASLTAPSKMCRAGARWGAQTGLPGLWGTSRCREKAWKIYTATGRYWDGVFLKTGYELSMDTGGMDTRVGGPTHQMVLKRIWYGRTEWQ